MFFFGRKRLLLKMTRFTERFIGGTSVLGESGHRRVFFCLADAFNMFEICDFMKGILCFGGEVYNQNWGYCWVFWREKAVDIGSRTGEMWEQMH